MIVFGASPEHRSPDHMAKHRSSLERTRVVAQAPEFRTGALVKATIVNGEILVENGEHIGAFSGRVLGNGKNGQASALG